jgi:hypothetical protein
MRFTSEVAQIFNLPYPRLVVGRRRLGTGFESPAHLKTRAAQVKDLRYSRFSSYRYLSESIHFATTSCAARKSAILHSNVLTLNFNVLTFSRTMVPETVGVA